VRYGTAVIRTEVTLCWRNQCKTVQLLTLTSDFIAPALWPAKSPDLKPLDYRIRSNLQERVSQPDSWRWPAEVAPDQEWEQFQLVFINEAVRQCHPRLLACIRAHGGHFEHKLLVCRIFAQTYTLTVTSVWLPIVDTYVFRWPPKTCNNYCRHWQIFTEIWHFVCSWTLHCCYTILLKSDIVCQSYGNIQWFTFFRTQCIFCCCLTAQCTPI